MFSCYLRPTERILSKASVYAGKDYEQHVKDLKKAKEDYREELDKSMANTESDMYDLPSPPAELAPPHLHIALTAINAALGERQGESVAAKQARLDLLAAWNQEVEGKSQEDMMKAVKIWRCRRPQKPTKQKKLGDNYCKLLFCVKSKLD